MGVADFNRDGHPDYALFNSSYSPDSDLVFIRTNVHSEALMGRPFPRGWALVATADFNGDGNPDYLLYNAGTRQTAIWYLNNNVFVSAAFGPTLPAGWSRRQ